MLAKNLKYPALSLEDKSIGYSIAGITITPEGKIFKISTINPIDESIAAKLGEALKNNKYSEAQNYINESIRRNPLNKELYQLRMTINRKLNRNDLIIKDIQKLQNFIPGVSLDELINKNETGI